MGKKVREEREETWSTPNSGGIRAGIARKMTTRRPRIAGMAYGIQRRTTSLYLGSGGGGGGAGLLSAGGGMALRPVIFGTLVLEVFL